MLGVRGVPGVWKQEVQETGFERMILSSVRRVPHAAAPPCSPSSAASSKLRPSGPNGASDTRTHVFPFSKRLPPHCRGRPPPPPPPRCSPGPSWMEQNPPRCRCPSGAGSPEGSYRGQGQRVKVRGSGLGSPEVEPVADSAPVAVPPYTTCKGQRKWRPRPSVPSGSIPEEDNKDESESGSVGLGESPA